MTEGNVTGTRMRAASVLPNDRKLACALALIDAAQGRNSGYVRRSLATVLGLASKRVYFALPRARKRSKSESLLVILLCGGLALALSFFFREGSLKPAAPAIFLLIIISVAHFWGRLAGLFVAVLGGLVFAAFLFEPYGSLAVCDASDRIVLLAFVLSAIAAACLSRSSDTRPK